jgi:oxygen-independent coproporphyrinogen-3 oxidase
MPVGIYISVPFCKSKCSYCNFASGVFSRERMQRYVDRLCEEITAAPQVAEELGASLEREVDTVYLGGGTPTILAPEQLTQVFNALRKQFAITKDAEITVECAPGTLQPEVVAALADSGVNRVSLGVQSFIDREARAVGRLHDRAATLADIERLRSAGIHDINVDLIAGLPFQTLQSWEESLDQAIATGVTHISVYMLEVDEDSRLGRELMAGGVRYHAHHVPDADLIADCYECACERLQAAGIQQYEISNFARSESESRHNQKYWTRQPYLGFGLDAHSMLPMADGKGALRFSQIDDLDAYLKGTTASTLAPVDTERALEEEFFLGLRLNRGISTAEIERRLGTSLSPEHSSLLEVLVRDGFLHRSAARIALTPRGRLVSNEIFERFLGLESVAAPV